MMLNLKKAVSVLTAFAFAAAIFIVCPIGAEAAENKQLTSAMVSDHFKSDKHISELEEILGRNVSVINSESPREITVYAPFQIPFYSSSRETALVHNENTWYCPAAVDGKITALLVFSCGNELFISTVIYLPTDLTEKLSAGEAYSLFNVEAAAENSSSYEDNGALTYAVDSLGDSIFIGRELFTCLDGIDVYGYKTDGSVYERVGSYDILSYDMEVAAKINVSMSSAGLSDGTVVTFTSVSDEKSMLCFNGSDEFIIREVGKDENGEVIYSLSPENKPGSRIKISGSTKLYIRCEVGGTVPIYSIRSAADTFKALAYTPDGAKVQKWKDSEDQQWIISADE
ncbi:MAG: hypothetical protein ACI4J5_05225 [Oscillospiraceae bacterium]